MHPILIDLLRRFLPLAAGLFPFLLIFFYGNARAETRSFHQYSLYTNRTAIKLEDVVTILVVEKASATNDAKTRTKSSSEMNAGGRAGSGLLDFIPGFDIGASNQNNFDGKGETERNGDLKAKIAARVIEAYQNGNLLIQGSKLVEINDEKAVITISGIIRPEDIRPDNTIYSFNLADAHITYTGSGDINSTQRAGPLTRIFNWLF